jgi:hypothetical protein
VYRAPLAGKRGGSRVLSGPQGNIALSLVRYLKDKDFVVLHIHCRSAEGVGDPATYARYNFLCRLHNVFALPEGKAKQLTSLSIADDSKSLEPLHLLELW